MNFFNVNIREAIHASYQCYIQIAGTIQIRRYSQPSQVLLQDSASVMLMPIHFQAAFIPSEKITRSTSLSLTRCIIFYIIRSHRISLSRRLL